MKNTTTGKIEKGYKKLIGTLKARNMTTEALKENPIAYNLVAESIFAFVSKVALLSTHNRALIKATGEDFEVFADDVCMHILNRLDIIFECNDNYVIPFTVALVNNKVIDICRSIPSFKFKKIPISNADEAEESEYLFTFLDDVAWSMLQDVNVDVEGSIIRAENIREAHFAALKALTYSSCCSRFELLCLLATKVLTDSSNHCMKTHILANAIDQIGLIGVSIAVYETEATLLGIPYTYFTQFTNDETPAYSSIGELSDKISKASNHCAVKLRKKIGGTRAIKKRTRK